MTELLHVTNEREHMTLVVPYAMDGYRVDRQTGEVYPAYGNIDVPPKCSLFRDGESVVVRNESGDEVQRLTPNWRKLHAVRDDEPLINMYGPFLGYIG